MDYKHLTGKYFKWYNKIIDNRLNNPITGYTETHHIIPKSLGGTNDPKNLVAVTAREHYLLHYLLTKFTEGEQKSKMVYAFNMMNISNKNQKRPINSILYEKNKIKLSEYNKGSSHPFYGKHHSEETRKKLSKVLKGREISEETRKKMSDFQKGKVLSEEHRKKISEAKKGKIPWNKGLKGVQKSPNKGIAQEQVECPYCGKIGGLNAMKRWHFNNCKHKD